MARKKGGKPAKAPAGEAKTDKGAARRVEQLKGKLTEAMRDPLMRDQIVRAIRAMLHEK